MARWPDWEGVSYNGSHGGHPGAVGTPIYGSLEGPGWKVNDLGRSSAKQAMGTASSGNGSLGRTDARGRRIHPQLHRWTSPGA